MHLPDSHRCQLVLGPLRREIEALAWVILRSGPRCRGVSEGGYVFSPSQSHCQLVAQTWRDRHCPDAQRWLNAPPFRQWQAPHVLLEHRIVSGVAVEKAAVLNPERSMGPCGARQEHPVRPTVSGG